MALFVHDHALEQCLGPIVIRLDANPCRHVVLAYGILLVLEVDLHLLLHPGAKLRRQPDVNAGNAIEENYAFNESFA